MITKEREDYLKAIYHLQAEESPVRTTSIARHIGVEPASVTGAIQRLAELKLLDYTRYQGVTLTGEGRRIALEVIRNHRLLELFLIKMLGYTWDEVHEEAERLEHAVSPLFIERIEEALGHPEIDPHGAPIPTKDGQIREHNDQPLSELPVGASGHISRVYDDDADLLRYLASLGLRPGVTIRVTAVTPYGGSIEVAVGDDTHALGVQAAEQIFVANHITDPK